MPSILRSARSIRQSWILSSSHCCQAVNGKMYVHTSFPNNTFALDLKDPGKILWQHKPKQDPAARAVACCDLVNRGAVYVAGKLIYATLDAHAIAVDLPGTRSEAPRRIAVGSGATSAVSAVEAAGRTRVVVDLFRPAGYTTRSAGNLLVLTVDAGAQQTNALAGVSEFASSSLERLADAFKTSSAQSLSAFQSANDFTSDAADRQGGTIDAQKVVYAVLAVIAFRRTELHARRGGRLAQY